jgi:hypothetical protein
MEASFPCARLPDLTNLANWAKVVTKLKCLQRKRTIENPDTHPVSFQLEGAERQEERVMPWQSNQSSSKKAFGIP